MDELKNKYGLPEDLPVGQWFDYKMSQGYPNIPGEIYLGVYSNPSILLPAGTTIILQENEMLGSIHCIAGYAKKPNSFFYSRGKDFFNVPKNIILKKDILLSTGPIPNNTGLTLLSIFDIKRLKKDKRLRELVRYHKMNDIYLGICMIKEILLSDTKFELRPNQAHRDQVPADKFRCSLKLKEFRRIKKIESFRCKNGLSLIHGDGFMREIKVRKVNE